MSSESLSTDDDDDDGEFAYPPTNTNDSCSFGLIKI